MSPEHAALLREPFPAEIVGKLPRVVCKACSDNKQARHCDRHKLAKCPVCQAYITEAHIHLDYVGHAATTDRLLKVDPGWSWEPMVVGPNGEPLVVNGGLWIRLTVCGVTRPGFGDGGSIKEMIGDAIRNAAMRFGVALDLWAKEDLHAADDGERAEKAAPKPAVVQPSSPTVTEPPPSAAGLPWDKHRQPTAPDPDEPKITPAQMNRLNALIGDCIKKRGKGESRDEFKKTIGVDGSVRDLAGSEAEALIGRLRRHLAALQAEGREAAA